MASQYQTEYVRPDTVDEAIEFLSDGRGTRVIAGGYSLLPLLKDGIATAERLVDISDVDELSGITCEDGEIRIGALTTHDRIAASGAVCENARALAEATDSVGDYQAKHQGTIAGNLVFADPKYDAPAAFLALGGWIVARGPDGERRIEADEWFRGADDTALDPKEIVTQVVVPDTERSGYVRTSEYSGYAIVGASAALALEDDTVQAARVAVNGAKPYPIRLPNVEAVLVGESMGDELRSRAAEAALRDVAPEALLTNDAAAGEYRRRLVRSYCRKAIEQATADPFTE